MLRSPDPCVFGGIELAPAFNPDGSPMVSLEWVPAAPEQGEDFAEHVPFGPWGMGGSQPAVPNLHGSSLGADASQWGVLSPGPQVVALGLNLATKVSAIAVAKDSARSSVAQGASKPGAAADDAS